MAHTPGPWFAVHNGHFWDISLEDRYMAPTVADTCASNTMHGEFMVDGKPGDHGEANARLIAAAPDLLDFAKDFVRRVEDGEIRSKKTYAAALALIAKAEGRS